MVVDGGVGAAPGRAGEGDGRDPGARAAHQQLGAGADEGRLRRPAAEAEAGRELLAHRAEDRRRVVGGGGADDHLAGEDDLLISPAAIRACGASRPRLRRPPAAGRCGSRAGRSDAGRSAAAARRHAARRAARPAPPPAARRHRPGATTALTVRKARSPLRQSETSGRTSEAGLERAPGRGRAAVGVEGEPAEPDRPGARRASRAARRATASRAGPQASSATSAKRRSPRERPRAPPRARPGRNRGPAAASRTSGRWPAARRRPPRRDPRAPPRR